MDSTKTNSFWGAGNQKFPSATILAYIAGFLDGDGSVFFQIVPDKSYRRKFQIRCSIAFHQKQSF